MAYETYGLCSSPDTATEPSNENCIFERGVDIGQTEVICTTDEMLPGPSESVVIRIHDKNQVIVSTMETIPESVDLTVIETNDENQVVDSTSEAIPELFESKAINDETGMITESTSGNIECVSTAAVILSSSETDKGNDDENYILKKKLIWRYCPREFFITSIYLFHIQLKTLKSLISFSLLFNAVTTTEIVQYAILNIRPWRLCTLVNKPDRAQSFRARKAIRRRSHFENRILSSLS